MKQKLYKVLCDRFPDHGEVIHRLARTNSSFIEIAQDYADVIAVLVQLRLSEDPTANSRIIEYRMIQEELEAEIELLLLDAVKSASPQ